MALALSSLTKSIPAGKSQGIGIAIGTFKGQQSIAASGTFLFTDPNSPGPQIIFNTGVGFGINKSTFGAAAGLSVFW